MPIGFVMGSIQCSDYEILNPPYIVWRKITYRVIDKSVYILVF